MKRQVGISLPKDIQEAVERWRLAQPVPPSKSAAIAAMVAEGLKIFEAKGQKNDDQS
jgi:hypothetical protein